MGFPESNNVKHLTFTRTFFHEFDIEEIREHLLFTSIWIEGLLSCLSVFKFFNRTIMKEVCEFVNINKCSRNLSVLHVNI